MSAVTRLRECLEVWERNAAEHERMAVSYDATTGSGDAAQESFHRGCVAATRNHIAEVREIVNGLEDPGLRGCGEGWPCSVLNRGDGE